MAVIYCIRNKINGKMYIGSAIDFHQRKMRHLRVLRKGTHHSVHLQRAWNKYGEDAFEFVIIEDNIQKEEMYIREQYYLDTYQPFGTGGYNMSHKARGVCLPGKDNAMFGKYGKDHPAYGRTVTDEERKHHREGSTGVKHHMTKEGKNKLSEYSKTRTGEKNGMYGKKLSPESKKKISEKRSIAIIQYDIETGDFVKFWINGKIAMEECKIAETSITKCCKRKVKSAGKFIWRYADEVYCDGSNVYEIENTNKILYNKRNRIY